MLDLEIRNAIKASYPRRIIVDEVKLGNARVDLLDLTKELHGYEIKSDGDNYSRLPNQIKNYNKYLSRITIFVGESKRDSILSIVPDFWGIIVVYKCPAGITRFETLRESYPNPYLDKKIAVTLLWKRELITTICELYNSKSTARYTKMRRWRIANLVQKELNTKQTIDLIRGCMIDRIKCGEWRD